MKRLINIRRPNVIKNIGRMIKQITTDRDKLLKIWNHVYLSSGIESSLKFLIDSRSLEFVPLFFIVKLSDVYTTMKWKQKIEIFRHKFTMNDRRVIALKLSREKKTPALTMRVSRCMYVEISVYIHFVVFVFSSTWLPLVSSSKTRWMIKNIPLIVDQRSAVK